MILSFIASLIIQRLVISGIQPVPGGCMAKINAKHQPVRFRKIGIVGYYVIQLQLSAKKGVQANTCTL